MQGVCQPCQNDSELPTEVLQVAFCNSAIRSRRATAPVERACGYDSGSGCQPAALVAEESPMELLTDEAIDQYAFRHTRAEDHLLQSLAERTQRDMHDAQMLTGRVEGRLLKLLVQLCRPRLVLEVGTYTGYSALSMAEGLGPDGRIITCEIDPRAQKVAQEAFDASPVGRRIEIRMGPALETIGSLHEEIDLSFIDADKEHYPEYYEAILERTRPGGLLVLDNMLWSGKVLNPQEEIPRILAALNRTIAGDERVENVLLTVRDGIQLVRKR